MTKKYTKLSIEDKLKAVQMVNKGMLQQEVADVFGVSHAAVWAWVNGRGMLLQKHEKTLSKIYRKKVIKLYKQKHSISNVADTLGISKKMVAKWLHEDGVDTTYSEQFINKVRERYKETGSCPVVAREFDVPWQTIRIWCQDLIARHTITKRYTKKQKQKAMRLRKQGYTYHDISRAIGCSQMTLFNWFHSE